jgi:hypothetical protein
VPVDVITSEAVECRVGGLAQGHRTWRWQSWTNHLGLGKELPNRAGSALRGLEKGNWFNKIILIFLRTWSNLKELGVSHEHQKGIHMGTCYASDKASWDPSLQMTDGNCPVLIKPSAVSFSFFLRWRTWHGLVLASRVPTQGADRSFQITGLTQGAVCSNPVPCLFIGVALGASPVTAIEC